MIAHMRRILEAKLASTIIGEDDDEEEEEKKKKKRSEIRREAVTEMGYRAKKIDVVHGLF
jgi:hypothetical protein